MCGSQPSVPWQLPDAPLTLYTEQVNHRHRQMTITEANLIWDACYGDNVTDGWALL